MFSIFHKNYFLKEELKGFVDIHNHILPGIDDGAIDTEASFQLISQFGKIGITKFVATPHIMNDYYPNNRVTIQDSLDQLHSALKEAGKEIRIKAAAEYMMDQSFVDLIEKEELLCLTENLVLVEMSYLQAPLNLKEILFKLQTRRYQVVLAHPERYSFYHSKDLRHYEDLKSRGCRFQLNILSIMGHYGKNIQNTAFKLLQSQMIDYLGTDTHNLRHLEKISALKLSKKQLDLLIPVIERTKEKFNF